jgi:hypothetical protein
VRTTVHDARRSLARTNARTHARTRDGVETVRAKNRVERVGVDFDVRIGDEMGGDACDAPGSFWWSRTLCVVGFSFSSSSGRNLFDADKADERRVDARRRALCVDWNRGDDG